MNRAGLVIASLAALSACGKKERAEAPAPAETAAAASPAPTPQWRTLDRAARADSFSYANFDEIAVRHLALDLDVKFDEKVLEGTATLELERRKPEARILILDTNDLLIASVEARAAGVFNPTQYDLSTDDPALGSALQIALPEGADAVRVAYRTSPEAEGLQWLSPEQTAGKTHPYMYSQNQSINARSMAPLQDTPAVRMTYSATIRTSKDLYAVMSAAQDPDGARDGEYRFDLKQPVASYLLAIAVGDIQFKAIDDHIGVYGEPAVLDAAAAEFSDTPAMEKAMAALYGPYRWERYDMLVLPPSFPYGGMENPRLTFLTPTAIAGDKSLNSLIAHELAHSWSGNLVTNADWRDGWLNEGVTSYVENRVMEVLYGVERAEMERALDVEVLKRDLGEAERPELTQLKLPDDLAGPDEGPSQVRYVKGMLFLKRLETAFGRDLFDPFLKSWFDAYAFKAVKTEDFEAFLKERLLAQRPDAIDAAEIADWLYAPGLPATAENPAPEAFAKVEAERAAFLGGKPATSLATANWTTQEWLRFVNGLPDDAAKARYAELDAAFELSTAGNSEIAAAWYLKSVKAGYGAALPEVEKFLARVGRGKFIYRIYEALDASGQGELARAVYADARSGYHPIAQRRIDDILKPAQ